MNSNFYSTDEHTHFVELIPDDCINMIDQQEALCDALTRGVILNNEAHELRKQERFSESVETYLAAISIKIRAYGENSVHVCISLSGLADAYLANKQLDQAFKQATRMERIAILLNSREQTRIASEILCDIAEARSGRVC